MTRRDFLALASTALPVAGVALPGANRSKRAQIRANPNEAFIGQPILDRILDKAIENKWHEQDIGRIVANVGRELIGTPYVGWTLERDVNREYCFVTLEGLDCVTFFESSLGIARALKSWSTFERKPPKPAASDVLREVTLTRYRSGTIGDFTSRLHYTTDWIFDNEKKRTIASAVDRGFGGSTSKKLINFMSTNSDTYRQLKAHPDLIPKMAAIENEMSSRGFNFLPSEAVRKIKFKLWPGDIVGFVSSRPGMDIDHVGIITTLGGQALVMHASSTHKKVVLDVSISEILRQNPSCEGIVVARPIWN